MSELPVQRACMYGRGIMMGCGILLIECISSVVSFLLCWLYVVSQTWNGSPTLNTVCALGVYTSSRVSINSIMNQERYL